MEERKDRKDQYEKRKSQAPETAPEAADASFSPEREGTVIEGKTYDLVVSGILEEKRERGEPRFVLTKGNFKRLKGGFTEAEIRDTVALIRELRRRLVVMAQLTEIAPRSKIYKAVAAEMDELYLAYELSGETAASGALNDMKRKREAFRMLRGLIEETPNTKRKR